LGFPTGWSFTTHKDFCWGTKKNNLPHQLAISCFSGAVAGDETPTSTIFSPVNLAPSNSISYFSGAVAGEEVEDFCEGSFRTHILYFVIALLLFIYFICIVFYQKPKKN
jgi:hypothetical protein